MSTWVDSPMQMAVVGILDYYDGFDSSHFYSRIVCANSVVVNTWVCAHYLPLLALGALNQHAAHLQRAPAILTQKRAPQCPTWSSTHHRSSVQVGLQLMLIFTSCLPLSRSFFVSLSLSVSLH